MFPDREPIVGTRLAPLRDRRAVPVPTKVLLVDEDPTQRLRAELARRRARERSLTEKVRRLERENEQLERLVCVDALTGIANRRHVLALLAAEARRSERDHTPLSVVMIDLDEFHAFNECYGHLGGDGCLRRVAGAMVSCLRRPSDFLGRYGGEEFVAILANTDAHGARVVAERLRATVAALAIPHDRARPGVVTISVGFATAHPTDTCDAAALLAVADAALLEAKSRGRDQVVGEAPPARVPALTPDPAVRFPRVTVDPWFADRIPAFLDEARGEATGLQAARRARDFERIRLLGKRLKTAARGFGLDEMRDVATALECAARLADRAAIRRAAEALEHYVAHVQVVYRRSTDAMPIALPYVD
jgi:diguanylate cyclase (GGDEF)-like protein